MQQNLTELKKSIGSSIIMLIFFNFPLMDRKKGMELCGKACVLQMWEALDLIPNTTKQEGNNKSVKG